MGYAGRHPGARPARLHAQGELPLLRDALQHLHLPELHLATSQGSRLRGASASTRSARKARAARTRRTATRFCHNGARHHLPGRARGRPVAGRHRRQRLHSDRHRRQRLQRLGRRRLQQDADPQAARDRVAEGRGRARQGAGKQGGGVQPFPDERVLQRRVRRHHRAARRGQDADGPPAHRERDRRWPTPACKVHVGGHMHFNDTAIRNYDGRPCAGEYPGAVDGGLRAGLQAADLHGRETQVDVRDRAPGQCAALRRDVRPLPRGAPLLHRLRAS